MPSTLNIDMRPQSFESVIGLETQIAAVRSKLDKGEVPRAFLLTGQFGTGKTTLAFIIARYVQGWDFPEGMQPSVQEINAANMTSIDDMRKLCESSHLRPMIGRYAVIILDEAHKLSKPAQECLLKEFESEIPSTVWIICTTDPDKLIDGIKAGRCFTLKTEGMNEANRKTLVLRAAEQVKHEGDVTEFLSALTKARISSPRKILMAFEAYHHGIPAAEAVGGMTNADVPEYHDIAFAVMYGFWDKDIPDWRFKGTDKKIRAVGALLKELDDRLKKKPKETAPATETDEPEPLEPEDIQGKPEVARALRAITGGFLKGRVLKGGVKAEAAANCLDYLGKAVPGNAFELEWALTLAALYKINKKLNDGK